MSVLIKGMEMPKENQRGLWAVIHSDGTVEYDTGDYGWQTLRRSAFNVPPHGALMDRDEFFAACPELVDGYKHITDGLVVIPASEEGE